MSPDAKALRRRLMAWYRREGRHGLPWRQTRDPYAVLVSEVMLQQTQVSRVLPYYTRWMERWPDAPSLAAASTADVIREWAGLGYNRRALQLQQAARAVTSEHGGRVPRTAVALRTLPGVGPYTAGAVACFAGGAREPVADTNIARVLARAVLGQAGAKALPPREVVAAAESLLPSRGARDHNLALMDLGALVCAPRPRCDDCPLAGLCTWRRRGSPADSPTGAARKAAVPFEETARFARGRIVDALRSGPRTAEALSIELPVSHRERLATYLEALVADGLVVGDGEYWALPDEGNLRPSCFARNTRRMLSPP